MTETLVIHDTDIDVRCEFLSRDARVHGLVAVIVVPRCEELFAEIIDCPVFFREPMSGQVSVERARTLKKRRANSNGVAS